MFLLITSSQEIWGRRGAEETGEEEAEPRRQRGLAALIKHKEISGRKRENLEVPAVCGWRAAAAEPRGLDCLCLRCEVSALCAVR